MAKILACCWWPPRCAQWTGSMVCGPVSNRNTETPVQILLRILIWWQESIKPNAGPFNGPAKDGSVLLLTTTPNSWVWLYMLGIMNVVPIHMSFTPHDYLGCRCSYLYILIKTSTGRGCIHWPRSRRGATIWTHVCLPPQPMFISQMQFYQPPAFPPQTLHCIIVK